MSDTVMIAPNAGGPVAGSVNRYVNAISGRLSLRAPQRESLELLARIADIIELSKDSDIAESLRRIQGEFDTVEDFERDFPSLCFALATGVGKTRLMGAFITYLRQAKGIRHFFVLAPNLTIYNKLIADFTPGTPKYVFQGIGEFATNPPAIITGETYESGRNVRLSEAYGQVAFDMPGAGGVDINIFNISKINSEVRGGNTPRIKRLSEYIGQSYFDYLAGLDDLVLIMDESHRYRASAGIRAINELKPVLGLELTATPFVERAGGVLNFKNTIYSYPIANAMADGYVKEPVVATRENFNPAAFTPEQLERIKLEDGVRLHENTKVELEVYARQNERPIVKPFMLVVARDTTHANALVEQIKSEGFFGGRYADKVITVHSKQGTEEADETVQRLLAVERPDEPTEIVVHVDKLKEGWDVTNLYTIVPLRAANARTLVEQSIGRGLRLPYGRKVGVVAVDRLTIVAHDKFQEIVDEANRPGSIVKVGIVIGRDVLQEAKRTVVVSPFADLASQHVPPAADSALSAESAPRSTYANTQSGQEILILPTPQSQAVARITYDVARRFEHLSKSADLTRPDIVKKVMAEVKSSYNAGQGQLDVAEDEPTLEEVVTQTLAGIADRNIDIPRIVVVPRGDITTGFDDFDLDTHNVRVLPIDDAIRMQELRTGVISHLRSITPADHNIRLEDYIVTRLIDFDDISYDHHAELLYKLAGEMVSHLRSYLSEDDEIENVLLYHGRQLANIIHSQMQPHFRSSATEYEVNVTKGFTTLKPATFAIGAGEEPRDVQAPVDNRRDMRSMLFGGFSKCLYPYQKFDVDPERRFAVVVDKDTTVLKWYKPAKNQFRIYYGHGDAYEPDFVVETADGKWLCEPKRNTDMNDVDVLAKAKAAREWCRHATEYEQTVGGKPWSYVLIPHNIIQVNMTLRGLVAMCG